MKILVMGQGFVGLTTALGFSEKGFDVYGYDVNESRISELKDGIVPFFENGLPNALKRNLNKSFFPIRSLSEMKESPDVVFFCVGTPCDDYGKADLTYLYRAIDGCASCVKKDTVFIVKSTIPPGTMKKSIVPYMRERSLNHEVAVNPEFLREGYCWKDFTQPDRIVCGLEKQGTHAQIILSELYHLFNAPIHFVSFNTAEFIKYLSNCMLATLISFSNEMAEIANAAGDVDIGKAFNILHEDNRLVGSGIAHYLYPGCGYGGYCLPKDTVALIQNALSYGVDPKIMKNVVQINNDMPELTAKRIIKNVNNKDARIGILGLSFKPNSDDVRDSSAAKIINALLKEGYSNIYAYDPEASDNFDKMYNLPIEYCASKEDVCNCCETVAIVTVWAEFYGVNKMFPDINWIDCRYFL